MYVPNYSASDGRCQPPMDTRPRNYNHGGMPFCHLSHQQHRWIPQFSHQYRDRPNFILQLRSDSLQVVKGVDTEALIQKLKFKPQRSNIASNYVLATLFYDQWSEVLETVVQLWEIKLNDQRNSFLPRLVSNIEVPNGKLDLNDRLKVLFLEKLKGLKDGDLVEKWWKRLGDVVDEIPRTTYSLGRPQRVGVVDELLKKRKALEEERDLILNRVQEFKIGIKCIERYLENREINEDGEIAVFRFSDGDIDWGRIYRLMMRECRRLDDGLPIYAHRHDILKQIHSQQVTVLVGETGSGKSTQLVQFLADSGVSGHGSTICTQPRKLAAISLAERVKENSYGCYDDTSVSCYSSYSSIQPFDSMMIFMTDHCLLQYYMGDKQLSRISCIVIDEAHERSLNTDLVLALIKNLLCQRPCLRLIIMSATVDADCFADYFFGCRTLHVVGRKFPVDIKYVCCDPERSSASKMSSYVCDVLDKVTEINNTESGGTILAFLTSQMEVEWACDKFRQKFQGSSAIVFPLHGKLSNEDQRRVFIDYPGKRKVIFATNIAETSLTIPGVKYVVDSGMVKESMCEPATGMNVLKVCRISQSSANQRAGRAGRTEPGTCYRLYKENDFKSMLPHHEPEIRRVHLGVAVLRIIALGVKNVKEFDFVDAPSARAIDMAFRNLVQIGALALKNDVYELTTEGREIVKLGVEPRLGKIILQCFRQRLGREGLVLAAVMANSSSIFCRVGTEEDKLKSDRLKVQFCHPNGDLFTLLAVYKEWEAVPHEKKNLWCWDNSINAKSMRRCHETVIELEACLKNELNIIVPSYWKWHPEIHTVHDVNLKKIILSALPENVAMYSGCDQLGYEVASTRKCFQLHPSCSLFNFCQRPPWVVFAEILNEHLVCVTACDFDYLSSLPHLPFDFSNMGSQQLQKRILTGFGRALLRRICGGKFNCNLHYLVSSIRVSCADERIGVEVNVDQNEVLCYASTQDMEKVCSLVEEELEYRKRFLRNECVEKSLYDGGPKVLPSFALFGAGAEIKHLELEKRYLTVDIFRSNITAVNEKELILFLERFTLGHICVVDKFNEDKDKWGRVTFSTPDAAEKAVGLNQFEFGGGLLKVVPYRKRYSDDHSIRSKISWARRCSKGVAIVNCNPEDVAFVLDDLSDLVIGGRLAWCQVKSSNSVKITGLDMELTEADLYQELTRSTTRQITGLFILRGNAVENPPLVVCEEAIFRELSPFMPRKSQGKCVRVQVFEPKPKDSFMTATVTFDRSLHLEAAMALEQIEGKVLPGCHFWQKIRCRTLFDSTVSCSAAVYTVIREQLDPLLTSFQQQNGVVECTLQHQHGRCQVKISACATKIVADLRRPLERLIGGTVIHHPDITPAVLQILSSREGNILMKAIQQDTQTYISFDKYKWILRVFGSPEKIESAKQRLVKGLLALHESRQLEIHLRDVAFPPDMMKRVVQHFGPDLCGLRQKVPELGFSLNTRRHSISIKGTRESKQKVEEIIRDLAETTSEIQNLKNDYDAACPICLCEVEDSYKLDDCRHEFCRLCLVEQCESAIRSHDSGSFPLRCTKEGCGAPFLLDDLKALLSNDRLDELFRASLGAYVAASGGTYRFCPSPDCPSVYKAADPCGMVSVFACGACSVETCTRCHLEYHPYLTCEKYRQFKDDPDSSLKEWCMGKENVKVCPGCRLTIEKVDGCHHVECRCGRHVCWLCLEMFGGSDDCYTHLRSVHIGLHDFVI